MLSRLLESLYSVIDKAPEKVLALRVRHPDGLAWVVSGRRLVVTTEAGGVQVADVDLESVTVDELASALSTAGCDVLYQNPDLSSRLAAILIDGEGRESVSNGDHLYAYSSLVWAIMDAYAVELETAERDGIDGGLRQAYMHTAEGDWLDYWGEYFGIPRDDGELDAPYLRRIVVEVLRPRNNAIAIEAAVEDIIGRQVMLFEPWRRIFTLDSSRLSGADHLHDGNYWTWTVFQPMFVDQMSVKERDRALAIINRNRPAGVLPVYPGLRRPCLVAGLDLSISFDAGVAGVRSGPVGDARQAVISDNLVLSDSERQFVDELWFAAVFTSETIVVNAGADSEVRHTWVIGDHITLSEPATSLGVSAVSADGDAWIPTPVSSVWLSGTTWGEFHWSDVVVPISIRAGS